MRLDSSSVPPEVYEAVPAEARARGTSVASIIRKHLSAAYGLSPNLPRRTGPVLVRERVTYQQGVHV